MNSEQVNIEAVLGAVHARHSAPEPDPFFARRVTAQVHGMAAEAPAAVWWWGLGMAAAAAVVTLLAFGADLTATTGVHWLEDPLPLTGVEMWNA
jgi:hypothetical protein